MTSLLEKTLTYRIEILVFVLALVIRLIVFVDLSQVDPIPAAGDMSSYYWQAVGIQTNSWPEATPFGLHPLMPVLIYFSFLLFGLAPSSGQLLMILISALACSIFTRAVINWYGSRAGLLAGLIAVFYQASVFYAHVLLDVSFTSLVIATALWYISLSEKRPTATLIAGLMLGFGSLGRGTLMIVVISITIYLLLYYRRQTWLLLVGTSLCLVPVIVRNHYYGVAGISSNTALNYWIGNNPLSKGYYYFPEGSQEKEDLQRLRGHYLEASLDYIREYPLDWLRLQSQKTAIFLFGPDGMAPEQAHLWAEGVWHSWILFLLIPNWLIDILAITGLIATKDRRRFIPLLWVWLPYTAATIMFFVGTRFRVPMEFVPITVVSVTILELKDNIGKNPSSNIFCGKISGL